MHLPQAARAVNPLLPLARAGMPTAPLIAASGQFADGSGNFRQCNKLASAMQSLPLSQPAQGVIPPLLDPAAALFLDFDGTLAEIAPVPDAVRLDPAMLAAVRTAYARLDGRVALLSGRPVALLVDLVPIEGLAIAGIHGLERRRAGGAIEAPEPHPGLEAARLVLSALSAREPRLLMEDKGLSIGLHYREAPWLRGQAVEVVSRLAHCHGLEVQTGKMVLELRTPGADKGDALRAFMAEPPFAGYTPVFVGDDDTDEAAFRAVAMLGGHGIRVGRAERPTSAAYCLPDVASVASWLGGQP